MFARAHRREQEPTAGSTTRTLEGCLREDLETKAHRGMAVLNPIKLIHDQLGRVMGAGHLEPCTQPALPHANSGSAIAPIQQAATVSIADSAHDRHFTIGKEVWIEREDFEEVPPKGYKRLHPSTKVRLKGRLHVIECTGCIEGRCTAPSPKCTPPCARHQKRHAGSSDASKPAASSLG
jgi:glutamyl/glutaminyl-tRNA synthetase